MTRLSHLCSTIRRPRRSKRFVRDRCDLCWSHRKTFSLPLQIISLPIFFHVPHEIEPFSYCTLEEKWLFDLGLRRMRKGACRHSLSPFSLTASIQYIARSESITSSPRTQPVDLFSLCSASFACREDLVEDPICFQKVCWPSPLR